MNPIDNPETAYLMAIRAQEAIQPKNTTQIIDRLTVTNSVVQAGTQQATTSFGGFIVSFALTLSYNPPPPFWTRKADKDGNNRKIQRPKRQSSKPKMPRRRVFPRTNFWIAYSSALGSTTIGA